MVSFLFIRHGESKDNLRQVWAGWKDSPLSNHGMRQAEALADDFRRMNLSFSAIYTSDLLRAKLTAGAVRQKQEGSSSSSSSASSETPILPTIQEVELLREQHFGAGEGRSISKMEKGISVKAHYARGKFPALHTRQQKFPGGESLDEVAQRAEAVIEEIIAKEISKEKEEGRGRVIAIFSHGIFIAELIAAIIRKDTENNRLTNVRDLRGMKNTGWTRLEVTAKVAGDGHQSSEDLASTSWNVVVNGVNRHAHLSNLHRQKGGIGSMAHDPSQQDIRAFLGGKQKPEKPGNNSLTKAQPY